MSKLQAQPSGLGNRTDVAKALKARSISIPGARMKNSTGAGKDAGAPATRTPSRAERGIYSAPARVPHAGRTEVRAPMAIFGVGGSVPLVFFKVSLLTSAATIPLLLESTLERAGLS